MAWVHDLDPFLVRFAQSAESGDTTMGVRWYGLAYLAGFLIGAWLMVFMARRSRNTLPESKVPDFITAVVLGTMIGGRVGYALFYAPELFTEFTSEFPHWGLLKIWQGGMASHGGIAGIIMASLIFARLHRLNWVHLADLSTLGGSIGIFFGRVANFINGELFGREAHPTLPWAVKFPREVFVWLHRDTQVPTLNPGHFELAKATQAAQEIGVDSTTWQGWLEGLPSLSAQVKIRATLDQILNLIHSGQTHVRDALGPHLTPRHPSQLYEAFLEGAVLFLIVFAFWKNPRRPGVVGILWLISYAVFRLISEAFRMPDLQIGFEFLGLTRGQWLSVGMLIISAILARIIIKPGPAIGGWGRRHPSN